MRKEPTPPQFLELLTKTSRKIRTAFNQQVVAQGLTYPRARALFHLAKKENVNQKELAHDLGVEQPTLVRLLDRMEEHGLVERRSDSSDRRVKLLALTAYGKEQAALVQVISDRIREQICKGVHPKHLNAAIELFDRISLNLAELEDIDVLK